MIIKSIIATAAVAAVLAIATPITKAHAGDGDIKLGIGIGGGFSGHYGLHAYNPGHISCWNGGRIAGGSGFNPVDCQLPGHKYQAWREDHNFLVRINDYGAITGGSRLF